MRLDTATEHWVERGLREHGFKTVFLDSAALLDQLPAIELLLIGRPPRIDWSRATRLRLLHVAGTGVDPLFPASGLRDDVCVTNSRGAHADAVRDHVLLLVLALTRDLPRAFAQQAERRWASYATPAIAGQRWCILGLGEVGRRVAQSALALGALVTGISRTGSAHALPFEVHATTHLKQALKQADTVILCLPHTQQTQGIMGETELNLLPSGARVVNVSRGGILDEAALERRLRARQLQGAALDVFADEPLPSSSSLWDCPRLIITPHSAGLTPDYLQKVLHSLVDAVGRLERGQLPLTLVSREWQY